MLVKYLLLLSLLVFALLGKSAGAERTWNDRVATAAPDIQEFQSPDRVKLTGWTGQRVQLNARNRLGKVDTDRLLEGYRQRPGRQAWDGEHVGK